MADARIEWVKLEGGFAIVNEVLTAWEGTIATDKTQTFDEAPSGCDAIIVRVTSGSLYVRTSPPAAGTANALKVTSNEPFMVMSINERERVCVLGAV